MQCLRLECLQSHVAQSLSGYIVGEPFCIDNAHLVMQAFSTATHLGSVAQSIGLTSTTRTQDSAGAQALLPTLPTQKHTACQSQLLRCRQWGAQSAQLLSGSKSVRRLAAKQMWAAGITMAGGDEKIPLLNELPLTSFIDQGGYITPQVEAGTEASVFAVLDETKKVQYIGFSKDVRNSLRTLMGRRPDKCHYYKLYNLRVLDQQRMLDIRNSVRSRFYQR